MIINKYTLWRRGIFKLQAMLPFTRRVKNLSVRLKAPRFAKKNRATARAIADSIRNTGKHPLFSQVEIETFNRCNGECSFCPVNKNIDPRTPTKMSADLFDSIIGQLAELDYTGSLSLYSNNEPLLDTRIPAFAEKARQALPNTKISLYTNGILLTLDLYKKLIPHLSLMVIDNYCTDFKFRPNIQEIIDYSSQSPDLDAKTHVTMRYLNEVMTSRGGLSPNKQDILPKTKPYGCPLPLKQIVIRPDGKLSLCCNDALGKMTLGDLQQDRLIDVWHKKENQSLRENILKTRTATPLCQHCDTFL